MPCNMKPPQNNFVKPSGETVMVKYNRNVPLHTVQGARTGMIYGRHKYGDIFPVDKADLPDRRFEVVPSQAAKLTPRVAGDEKAKKQTLIIAGDTEVGEVFATSNMRPAPKSEVTLLAEEIGIQERAARSLCAANLCSKEKLRGKSVQELRRLKYIGLETARKIVKWAGA